MRSTRLAVVWALLVGLAVLAPGDLARAQEDDPAVPDEPQVAVPEPPEPQEREKKPYPLFFGVGGGVFSADDLNTSLKTNSSNVAFSNLSLDDQLHTRAAIGWQLPEGNGAFRLIFRGYKEEEYVLESSGVQLSVRGVDEDGNPVDGAEVNGQCDQGGGEIGPCLLPWWELEVKDGDVDAKRFPPLWTPTDWLKDDNNELVVVDGDCVLAPGGTVGDDLDPEGSVPCNGLADPNEVRFSEEPDRTVVADFGDSLQNQAQTWDLVYGREFGRRRYSSKWWAGLRYFEYKGNVPAAAWLALDEPGAGFTDGSLLRLLNVRQETTGFGPTAAWEVDFNFYDKGLVLYLRGQSAFTFNSMEMDTGTFFFPVAAGETTTAFIGARLRETRDKSTWQNSGDVGVQINLKNGLQFDLGYSLTGLLDVVLLPSQLSGLDNFVLDPEDIPEPDDSLGFNTSTQDYILDGWYASVAYQF